MGICLHVQKVSHTSSGDFESTFIKAGDSETKKELRVEEVTGGSLDGDMLGFLEKLQERNEPRSGCS